MYIQHRGSEGAVTIYTIYIFILYAYYILLYILYYIHMIYTHSSDIPSLPGENLSIARWARMHPAKSERIP